MGTILAYLVNIIRHEILTSEEYTRSESHNSTSA